jgi:hypothetical protein
MDLIPTLLLQGEGLIKFYDLMLIFYQKIIIYRFIAIKPLSFLAEPSLCERERLSQRDAFGRVSLIYLK